MDEIRKGMQVETKIMFANFVIATEKPEKSENSVFLHDVSEARRLAFCRQDGPVCGIYQVGFRVPPRSKMSRFTPIATYFSYFRAALCFLLGE
jgi:hypothetical protein